MEMYKSIELGLIVASVAAVVLMAWAMFIMWPTLVDLFKKKEEGPVEGYRLLVPRPEVLLSKEAGFLLVERCSGDCPQPSYVQVFGKRFEDPASIAAATKDMEVLSSRGHDPFISHRFLREPPSKEAFRSLLALYEARLHEWRTTQQGKEEFRVGPRPMPPCDFVRITFAGDEV